MNADALTIKMLSFFFLEVFKEDFPPQFPHRKYLKALSPTEPARPVLKGTDGSLYAWNLQKFCKVPGTFTFWQRTHEASTLGKSISGLLGEPAGKWCKNCSLQPEPQLMRPASLNLDDPLWDLHKSIHTEVHMQTNTQRQRHTLQNHTQTQAETYTLKQTPPAETLECTHSF